MGGQNVLKFLKVQLKVFKPFAKIILYIVKHMHNKLTNLICVYKPVFGRQTLIKPHVIIIIKQ